MKVIRKIGLAVFKDKKILLVKTTKNNIRFLGGKVEGNKTDLECLGREVKEEVNAEIDMNSLILLHTFKAPILESPDSFVEMPLYTGSLLNEPIPASEVTDILFADSTLDADARTPLTEQVFQWLKENGYIN